MASINIADKSIVGEVFRFVAIRNPQRSTPMQQALGIVQHRPAYAGAFYEELTEIRNDSTLDAPAKRSALFTASQSFLAGTDGIRDIPQLVAEVGDLPGLYQWIQSHASGLVAGQLETAWPAIGSLSDLGKGKLWDNLLAMLIAGGKSTTREALMEAILAQHFLENFQNEDGLKPQSVIDTLAMAHVALPPSIFPLPNPTVVSEEVEPDPEEALSAARADWRLIQRLLPALQAEQERRISAWRLKAPILDENDEPMLPALDLRCERDFIEDFDAEAWPLVKRYRINEDDAIGHVIDVLIRAAAGLEDTLANEGTPGNKVIVYAGAIWGKGDEATATSSALRETAPENSDPQWTDWQAKQENPNAQSSCGVRPLGVADLKKVEQKLCCYAPGEVAHIENILQGEYKERSTRRLKRREETYGTVTEREKIDERDSVSTERFELSKETAQLLQKDTSLAVGVNSSYYGPVNVMVDAQFATSNSTTQSDSLANNYAKEVTERAVNRITERVREEHYLTLVEEFEENNKHGLDNRAGTQHVVGLYRWADKIYEAKVVNYGKRLMMEFMVPEPAHFHTWAMSQPPN